MTPKDGDQVAAMSDEAKAEAIQSLLLLCAENQVSVPPRLRAELLGEEFTEEEQETMPLLDSLLGEKEADLVAELEGEEDEISKEFGQILTTLKMQRLNQELRMEEASYTVTNYFVDNGQVETSGGDEDDDEEEGAKKKKTKRKLNVDTVYNTSIFGKITEKIKRLLKTGTCTVKKRAESKTLLDCVTLRFEPGKMYLVLGVPGAGKSTLLRLIADTLRKDQNHVAGGKVSINGVSPDDKDVIWSNLVMYVDQIDRLHAYLTVQETLEFAWQCRNGGTHASPVFDMSDSDVQRKVKEMDDEHFYVNRIMDGLGIARVKDTFVGDNMNVRGVSGGEKKRVTVAEMMCTRAPIGCFDEMSTGLDSATTFDIVNLMGKVTRLTNTIKIVSLLAPPPETVALFDEIVLLDSGRIIYSGPTKDVIRHFEKLGYKIPDRMDMADWLVALPTSDGKEFLVDKESKHLTAEEFQQQYDSTGGAVDLRQTIKEPVHNAEMDGSVKIRYHNPWFSSLKLLVYREMTLWWRDKYQLKARVIQDLVMGIVSGTLFWQQNEDPQSLMGVLFQSLFFVCLGAMMKVPAQFEPRSIFYKQQDANFFPTGTFVAGRSLAGMPTSIIDGLLFGSIIYWFVGLAHNEGASVANYFIFVLVILAASFAAGLQLSIFSAIMKDKPSAQAAMSVSLIVLVLFSGFTVQPNVIPDYWIWAYWMNLFAWALRSLIVNEFQSGKYDNEEANGMTTGENILDLFGFALNGEAFGFEWVWYGILFCLGIAIISVFLSVFFLAKLRFETGLSLRGGETVEEDKDLVVEDVKIPFQKVNLTFKDVHYTVKSSITKEQIELLKGIDGFVEAGKMTALMGSSGAGKTTLMDVLALRKSSGEIAGDVRLNGHAQDPASFRRCTGYVEQFDEQSPTLTILETVQFSAKLRLEETDPAVTPESTETFIAQTLDMLELTTIQDLQVGSDLTGGLSFEQKKRLSIAVEVASNPSVLFLDEPTSGLDSRAAGIVMRGLKKIALTGRAVCATIHQPSIAIFNSFDSLLLLKRGGETVFFGELGDNSSELISYLERYPDTPKIRPGENPATWMLQVVGAGNSVLGGKPFDYAASYAVSSLREKNIAQIKDFCGEASSSNLVSFPNKYATNGKTQNSAVFRRITTIYWRSPTYNLVRLLVSGIVALLFGSVYASQRTPQNEADMNSRVASIFITALFLAVNAYNTVLSVFEVERNMFYRHKQALMYNARSVAASFTVSEIPFILLASMIFCVCFYFLVGFEAQADKFFWYYLFMTLNLGLFTFLGQMVMSLVKDSVTGQGIGGLLIGLTSLFSGLLLRPQNITGFWSFAYWLMPGHYVLEGLVVSQFNDDDTPIEASFGSSFYQYLVDQGECIDGGVCIGTSQEWVLVSFGGEFTYDHLKYNVLYLLGAVLVSRILTVYGLMKFSFLAK